MQLLRLQVDLRSALLLQQQQQQQPMQTTFGEAAAAAAGAHLIGCRGLQRWSSMHM